MRDERRARLLLATAASQHNNDDVAEAAEACEKSVPLSASVALPCWVVDVANLNLGVWNSDILLLSGIDRAPPPSSLSKCV